MNSEFIRKYTIQDKGLRAALGSDYRAAILGQFDGEKQDFLLLALDRFGFLNPKGIKKGFILTMKIDDNNVTFDAYMDFVDDMYSIGHIDVIKSMNYMDKYAESLPSIELKISELSDKNLHIHFDELHLDDDEKWFENYLTENRFSLGDASFEKRELENAVFCFKAINSFIKQERIVEQLKQKNKR